MEDLIVSVIRCKDRSHGGDYLLIRIEGSAGIKVVQRRWVGVFLVRGSEVDRWNE